MLKLLGVTLALLVLICGCATGGYYQTSEEYVPYITDVDPSFYDGDPTLRHWYTYPYWDPNRGGR